MSSRHPLSWPTVLTAVRPFSHVASLSCCPLIRGPTSPLLYPFLLHLILANSSQILAFHLQPVRFQSIHPLHRALEVSASSHALARFLRAGHATQLIWTGVLIDRQIPSALTELNFKWSYLSWFIALYSCFLPFEAFVLTSFHSSTHHSDLFLYEVAHHPLPCSQTHPHDVGMSKMKKVPDFSDKLAGTPSEALLVWSPGLPTGRHVVAAGRHRFHRNVAAVR